MLYYLKKDLNTKRQGRGHSWLVLGSQHSDECYECVCGCVCVPDLQGQCWSEQSVSNSANLSRVSPNQLNHCDVPQVQSTLSMLRTGKINWSIRLAFRSSVIDFYADKKPEHSSFHGGYKTNLNQSGHREHQGCNNRLLAWSIKDNLQSKVSFTFSLSLCRMMWMQSLKLRMLTHLFA